jgi:CheY-like chemotaxis protein
LDNVGDHSCAAVQGAIGRLCYHPNRPETDLIIGARTFVHRQWTTTNNFAFDTLGTTRYAPRPSANSAADRPLRWLPPRNAGAFRLRSTPRVLIVDESAESREVLATLLARRGATTIEAQHPEQAAQLANLNQLDLIVLDAESDRSLAGAATAELEALAGRQGTPVVILGTVRTQKNRPSVGLFIAKPYHYGPLIHRIEGLLAAA